MVKVKREVKRAILAAHLTPSDVAAVLAIKGNATPEHKALRSRLGTALLPMYENGWDRAAMALELGCKSKNPTRQLASIVAQGVTPATY